MDVFTLKKGVVTRIDVSKINNNPTWVRCIGPNTKKILTLSKISKLPVEEFLESIEEDERPKVSANEHLEIIYRSPFEEDEEIFTMPIYFYLYKNIIITIEKKRDLTLESFAQLMDTKKGKQILGKGFSYFVYSVIDAINDRFLSHVDEMAERVEISGEDTSKTELEKVYSTSVTLSYFNQALLANKEVLTTLRKCDYIKFKNRDRKLFTELYFNSLQIIDTINIQRDIVTNLFNLKSIVSSDRQNRFTKRLASLAFIIMIPTLISGMYGMNFAFIPLKQHQYGFHITVAGMVLLAAVFSMIFIKMDWL